MISFDNTENAFVAKTNADLNRSYSLFKAVSSPTIVNIGNVLTKVALAIHLPIKWIIKPTIFKQFCGGESIKECEQTITDLHKYKIGTILDYSVEGKESEKDFERCKNEILITIDKATGNSAIPFCVFKISGLARHKLLEKVSNGSALNTSEESELKSVRERVNTICKKAFDNNVRIFIDAEESWTQKAMDDLANQMMEMYNKEKPIVYNTYQLYRKDRLEYLKSMHEQAQEKGYFLGAKLVRGAYMEKERDRAHDKGYPSPIHDTKEGSDNDYDLALKYCIENISNVAICAGTHNEKSSLLLTKLMKEHKLENDHPHIHFSQLLGMSDHISYNLSLAGYNVTKYVPYGPVKDVLPYLIRRAQENTSVKGQTGRELSLIISEKKRRKSISA